MAKITLIGIDVGTTATKAVLIDEQGKRLASFAHDHPMARPQPGFAEQNPDHWMDGVLGALHAFSRDHDLGGLAAIGMTSQVNSHVFVDAKGTPLLPAMTWQDGRSAPDAATLDARITLEEKLAWFGAPMPIDASHALTRIAYVARVHPELYARTSHVLAPKDYCILQLTGTVLSDPISAVGLVNADGYIAPLLDRVPGAAERLPPLAGFIASAGPVRAGLPCAGTPVIIGTMDAWSGMFGVGVVADGDAMYQCGTSEVPGIVSSTVHPTPGVIVFPPHQGIVMHAAPIQSGGAALSWLAGVLNRTPPETAALAATIAPGANLPLFLPHLQGERAPFWDRATRGVFARLDGSSGAPEMAHTLLEGVALAARFAFEALYKSSGVDPHAINIGGGGAKSDLWCQIRADVLGKPLRRSAAPESAALGAAILGGLGVGIGGNLAGAVGQLVQFDCVFEPNLSLAAYYNERASLYLELYESLKPFNGRF